MSSSSKDQRKTRRVVEKVKKEYKGINIINGGNGIEEVEKATRVREG